MKEEKIYKGECVVKNLHGNGCQHHCVGHERIAEDQSLRLIESVHIDTKHQLVVVETQVLDAMFLPGTVFAYVTSEPHGFVGGDRSGRQLLQNLTTRVKKQRNPIVNFVIER